MSESRGTPGKGSVINQPLPVTTSLPFPPRKSGSVAGITMQESTYAPIPAPKHLPDGSPNVLVILVDDAGPGLPSPLGGEVSTPNLERVLGQGLGFNRFHTTAMCSPTRASLLTGRNHHRVGNGQIAELANDWDGYSGTIPRTCATLPEILRNYGYATSAFGKWHNTPAAETTAAGPYDNWPTGLGFEYFYGFLAGEASQYEPNLVRNTTVVLPPKTPEEGYHLSEDLADDAIRWLRSHKTLRNDAPFFMYWASGAIHGPHHVPKEWSDKYAGKFDDGWDAYRERVHKRAIEKGWIPASAALTPRHETLASWESIPEDEKPFQRRLMEVAAGYAEHVDHQIGRVLDSLDDLGFAENTLVFYIWGDNGSSGEGQNGTISELLAQNGIPSTVRQHIDALEGLGGLDALGTPLTDNQYHAAWAWAGSTPYQGMKLLASHLGGTRNPMAVSWPARIAHDPNPRSQFTHCTDLAPTVLEILGITQPTSVNGISQQAFDGDSFAYAIDDPAAKTRKSTQYFEIMGSRSIYHNGWMASATGPRLPWVPGLPAGIRTWTPDSDVWELYNLEEDWSQANDIAAQHPDKLAQLKDLFLVESAKNDVLPVGGGLWVVALHPEMRIQPPYTEWEMYQDSVRIPEFCAPALGNTSFQITFDLELPENPEGVLFKLGSNAGGVTMYIDQGKIKYEYNLFLIQRTRIAADLSVGAGPATITLTSTRQSPTPVGGLDIDIQVNGTSLVTGAVPQIAPLLFTANDCLDIGQALGSPVALEYRERAPFKFNGKINRVHIKYT